jgi:hypothetical protein
MRLISLSECAESTQTHYNNEQREIEQYQGVPDTYKHKRNITVNNNVRATNPNDPPYKKQRMNIIISVFLSLP